MKPKFEAIILDLDGTTVASRENALPSQRVVDAVQAAQKKIHVAVATGRPYSYALPVIKSLGLTGPGVFNGGAEIVDCHTGEFLQQQLLSIEALKELVFLSQPFGYKLYSDADNYSQPISSPSEIDAAAAKFFIGDVRTQDALHILEELSAVNAASAHPTTSWGEGDVVDIHVTHVNGTKRHGVERLISLLGISKAVTVGIGDSHNDIPLLEAVGFSVAMGDAPTEVKAVADHIAPSLENDGVADTIERFILATR